MPPRRSTRASSSRVAAAAANNKQEDEEHEKQSAPLKDSNSNSNINKKATTNTKDSVQGSKTKATTDATAKKKSPAKRKKTNDDDDDDDASVQSSSVQERTKTTKTTASAAKAKKTTAKTTTKKSKTTAAGAAAASMSEDEHMESSNTKTAKTTKKAAVQCITEKDPLVKLWDKTTHQTDSYTLTIASWNVAGLRAVLKKDPQALASLVQRHDIDILCLQETKLQESHLDDPKLQLKGHLLEAEGYDAYYSCSTVKKGYAGTAVFVRRQGTNAKKAKPQKDIGSYFGKQKDDTTTTTTTTTTKELPVDPQLLMPQQVTYSFGGDNNKHNGEGRIVCLDFPTFTMCNLYVPNSGQKLDRLDYRTKEWDKDLLAFMQQKQRDRKVPILWLGDLNVAHKEYEAYNFGAKHLDKQAGLTPQERASFSEQLEAGFVDVFRHLHPTAKGHYTYWSQRAGNREPNKGLRLDYFVADPTLLDDSSPVVARDSYMLPDQMGSDHCPVVLELEIKKP